MDIYVVGLYKKGKSIQGFRLLSLIDDAVDVKDVGYNSVKNVISSGMANFVNVKLDRGEIKGINGSLDRYGIVGKTQSLVVLRELVDDKGTHLGYFCSDTTGNTRNLSEKDVIKFADAAGIANGKIVPGENGVRHLSTIEGSYIRRAVKIDNKQTHQQNVSKPVTEKVNTVEEQKSTLSKDIVDLISKVKARPEYSNSYIKKIVATVEKYGKCSDKQKTAIEKEYNKWLGIKPEREENELTDDIRAKMNRLKTHADYSKDFVSKVVATVERTSQCSDKQKKFIEDTYKKWFGDELPLEVIQEDKVTKTEQLPLDTKDNDTEQEVDETPLEVVSNPTEANKVKQRLDKARTQEDNKRKNEDKTEAENIAKKALSKKEKRALLQTVMSDDLMDYSISKGGTAYIEGFKKDAEVPETLIIPETVNLNGKTYKVTGISIEAFMSEPIKHVVTSSNIDDIGQSAFRNCSALETADLSKSKHSLLAAFLFRGCSQLNQLNVGSYVQRIHEYALSGCNKLTNLVLPACTTTIARGAVEHCYRLESVKHSAKNIDFGAFLGCTSLYDFDFSTVNQIGPQSFRRTGLRTLVLTENTTSVGDKAFSDCDILQTVTIEEGVKEIGTYCFAKADCPSAPEGNPDNLPVVKLDTVYAPKSLTTIGVDAFRHVGQVIGWTGSVAESKCLAYQTPFKALDCVNTQNSTRVRVKSQLLGNNPIEALHKMLTTNSEGKSNPEFEIKKDKLVNIEFSPAQLSFFGVETISNQVEPNIKFKVALNYLQDVADLFQAPLTGGVLRLQNTFYVKKNYLYDDGYNRLIKISYVIMDSLEKGEFIVAFIGNKLVYMVECNLYTDIEIGKNMETNLQIPVSTFLHSGDIIGEKSTISGKDGVIRLEDYKRVNVGYNFYKRIYEHAIIINTTKKDEILYIPADSIAITLHDRRADKLDGEEKIKDESKSVIEVLTYEQMLAELGNIRKNIGGYKKFFDELASISQSEVDRRIKYIGTIEEEKEAQLFRVSKEFNKIVDASGSIPNPNLLTYALFNELANSYWMVPKDIEWLNSTGKKSLNRVSEYHIGKYKLLEYKSNQIVKFSNPYMNGQKGAYVFTLSSGNTILGVYASRYSMSRIVEKLYDLTHIDAGVEPVELMTNAAVIDKVNPKLFYNFYDVMYSKNGWSFNEYNKYSRYDYAASFHISMYKPTGIFYLTMETLAPTYNAKREKVMLASVVMPILPIGNMDRALMVATTTNTNAKDFDLYEELLDLSAQTSMERNTIRIYDDDIKARVNNTLAKYVEARRLVMIGDKDVEKYKSLISDRAVYMLGTVHQGVLQREHDVYDEVELENALDDIDLSDINIDESPEESYDDIDIDVDDEMIDFGGDEDMDLDDDDDTLSDEQLLEVQKELAAQGYQVSIEQLRIMAMTGQI